MQRNFLKVMNIRAKYKIKQAKKGLVGREKRWEFFAFKDKKQGYKGF